MVSNGSIRDLVRIGTSFLNTFQNRETHSHFVLECCKQGKLWATRQPDVSSALHLRNICFTNNRLVFFNDSAVISPSTEYLVTIRPLNAQTTDENWKDSETEILGYEHNWFAFEYLPFKIQIFREFEWIENLDILIRIIPSLVPICVCKVSQILKNYTFSFYYLMKNGGEG